MNSLKSVGILMAVICSVFLLEGQEKRSSTIMPLGKPVQIKAPLGLPPVPIPTDNPPTAETIALGRRLYYDPILSLNNTVSCATCHSPQFGFADPKPVSEGVGRKPAHGILRPSPTRRTTTCSSGMGRAASLEQQAQGPVQNPVEMAHSLKGVEQKLNADEGYRREFAQAWGPGPITYEMVGKSIASFERTVISGNSPFDRWKYGHDKNAVSPAVKRGFIVFTSAKKGNCAACHLVGEKHALFMDNKFHDVGVSTDMGNILDPGRFAVTSNETDRGKFKTPSLRNIALTAPYMSDGSLKNLKEAIDFYIGGGNSNPNLDSQIHVLDFLSGQERADLLEFLKSLTGEMPPDLGPPTTVQAAR